VYRTNMQPIAKAEVQIRNMKTGERVSSTFSDTSGSYAFKALRPGTYVVEVVDRSGRVIGMSAPFALGSAPTVNVSVVAVAEGAAASGGHAGFSLFGLGPVTSLAVMGAAGAAAVTAVVATRPDTSPSRDPRGGSPRHRRVASPNITATRPRPAGHVPRPAAALPTGPGMSPEE
jgi:hypothetical protein